MGNQMTNLIYSKTTAYHDICTVFSTRGKWTIDISNDYWLGWEELVPKWTIS